MRTIWTRPVRSKKKRIRKKCWSYAWHCEMRKYIREVERDVTAMLWSDTAVEPERFSGLSTRYEEV